MFSKNLAKKDSIFEKWSIEAYDVVIVQVTRE